jgi:hypothetical protein
MHLLPGFLASNDLTALRELHATISAAGHLHQNARGYAYSAVHPIPTAILPLYTRARDQLGASAGRGNCFFLTYENSTGIAPHTDTGRALRLIALVEAGSGGELIIDGDPVELHVGDAVVFRPGVDGHRITPVTDQRVIWSVGSR